MVSIRTRPEGRVNREAVAVVLGLGAVSIRTRPEGRVNRRSPRHSLTSRLFQSAPGPRAG